MDALPETACLQMKPMIESRPTNHDQPEVSRSGARFSHSLYRPGVSRLNGGINIFISRTLRKPCSGPCMQKISESWNLQLLLRCLDHHIADHLSFRGSSVEEQDLRVWGRC